MSKTAKLFLASILITIAIGAAMIYSAVVGGQTLVRAGQARAATQRAAAAEQNEQELAKLRATEKFRPWVVDSLNRIAAASHTRLLPVPADLNIEAMVVVERSATVRPDHIAPRPATAPTTRP